MHYSYDSVEYANHNWIRSVHKVTNLESNYAAIFTEVHVTIPTMPGDLSDFPSLPHITLVTTKAYRYHWYIHQQKISDKRRIEQIGTGNKRKVDGGTSSEKAICDLVMKDIREKAWC
jgi:hypothetical protein